MDTSTIVSESLQQQHHEEGWFVLKRVLSDEQLAMLREFAQTAMDQIDAEMDANRVNVLGLNHRGRRYFASGMPATAPALREFLFGDLMADICRVTLGPTAYQFVEQYVIKCSDHASSFSCHQDSGFLRRGPRAIPHVLDSARRRHRAERSRVLLPYSRAGVRTYVKHLDDPITNDRIGYFGTDPGIPIMVPAGNIACFSSVVFHRSGPNVTNSLRRAYLAQYSPEVILGKDGSTPWRGFEPFLRNREIVRHSAAG